MLPIELFDFNLPQENIAQVPTLERDASRLMVIDRKTQKITHTLFKHILEYLPDNAGLIRNDVSVLKARLHGYREGNKSLECLLVSPSEQNNTWWCLIKPGKKMPIHSTFGLSNYFNATILEKTNQGLCKVYFDLYQHESIVGLSEAIGQIPLPPYIQREKPNSLDQDRYQTIYANPIQKNAIAAPTAGLHFTEEIIANIHQKKIPIYNITLNVGIGTFQPIKTSIVQEHNIHHEKYYMPSHTNRFLKNPKERLRIAVGTTTTRAIEHFMSQKTHMTDNDFCGNADIFIYPPAFFSATDGLITNFHLPKSTLLCLVSAFLTPGSKQGIDWLKNLYQEAIALKYRFYSYGDAMLII